MIKTVMKYAVNYDKVVNFLYDDKDFVTNKIIEYYKNYVLNENESNRKIRSLDNILDNYINDDNFRVYVKTHINEFNTKEYGIDYYYDMDMILSKLFKNYLYYREENIAKTKWL